VLVASDSVPEASSDASTTRRRRSRSMLLKGALPLV
jgi:hypothetical protein